jgi:hypothetical protein
MAILKLEVGKPITMRVASVEQAEGQFGPQTKFEFRNGDVLFLSRTTAERQLERIGGLAPNEIVRFEKVQKGTKTFVNIDRVDESESGASEGNGTGGAHSAPRSGAPTTGKGASAAEGSGPKSPPATTPAAPAKPSELYEKVTDYVLATIVPKMKAAGVPVTHEGTSAQIATLFIAANNGHR